MASCWVFLFDILDEWVRFIFVFASKFKEVVTCNKELGCILICELKNFSFFCIFKQNGWSNCYKKFKFRFVILRICIDTPEANGCSLRVANISNLVIWLSITLNEFNHCWHVKLCNILKTEIPKFWLTIWIKPQMISRIIVTSLIKHPNVISTCVG